MTKPQLFTVTFWEVTANNVIIGAATGALNALILGGIGSADAATHVSVPWWGVLTAAAVGALLAFLYAVIGQQVPGTGPASLVSTSRSRQAARRPVARKRQPQKAPTTADLKSGADTAPKDA